MTTTTQPSTRHRARWAAIGAAVAVSVGAGGIGIVKATAPAGASAYVATEPCRLFDTRPDDALHIGPHSTLGPDSKITVDAVGDVGECAGAAALPADATALQLNVTAIGPTAATNLRLYPGAGDPPNASSLNPAPGQRPIPNAVTVQLDGDGVFSIYNFQGSVDVAVDVVGHYSDHDHDDRYHTKDRVNSALADKANTADVYTKAEIDVMTAAAAHGSINRDGTVRPDESRNLTDANVTRLEGQDGEYCFHDLPFDAVNAVATSSFPNGAQPVVRTSRIGCPENTSLFVEMRTLDRGNVNTPFRIVIYAG